MVEYLKKHLFNILTCAVFVIAAVFAVIALLQNLRPVDAIIASLQRVLQVSNGGADIENSIRNFTSIRDAVMLSYTAVILFLLFMAGSRICKMLNLQIPAVIMPVLSCANILLLIIAAAIVGDFGAGLGLSPAAENTAASYLWYAVPKVMLDSNILYLAPTFWTIFFPMVFVGILPLITGLKTLFYDKINKTC